MNTKTPEMKSAFAIVSAMLLLSAVSVATMLRAEAPASGATQSFVGTAPNATTVEPLPPQF